LTQQGLTNRCLTNKESSGETLRGATIETVWRRRSDHAYRAIGAPRTPPPLVLGPREQAILEAVYAHRYLTRNQIVRLLFNPRSATWVDEKLKRLYHNGYLERLFLPVAPGSGSPPAVYCLDRKGRDLLAELRGLNKTEVFWRKTVDTARDLPFLAHTLAINGFRITLSLACQQQGFALSWLDERTLKSSAYKAEVVDADGQTLVIVPDGYGRLRRASSQACFFLELNNGSQEKKAFRRKVRGHLLFAHGPYQERYRSQSLTALLVSNQGEMRLREMRAFTREELLASGEEADWELFLLANLAEHAPENILTQPIWRTVGEERRCALWEG